MDSVASEALRKMDEALNYVIHHKPPISSNRTKEITKIALSSRAAIVSVARKIEEFIARAPVTHRLSGLYLVDSICKARNECTELYRQYFAQNVHVSVSHVLQGAGEKERESIKKVVRLWVERKVFPLDTVDRTVAVMRVHSGYSSSEIDQLLASFAEGSQVTTDGATQASPIHGEKAAVASDSGAQFPVGNGAKANEHRNAVQSQPSEVPQVGNVVAQHTLNQKPVLDSEALENLVNTLPNLLPPPSFVGPCFTIPLETCEPQEQIFYDEEEDQEDPRKVIASRNIREKEACRRQESKKESKKTSEVASMAEKGTAIPFVQPDVPCFTYQQPNHSYAQPPPPWIAHFEQPAPFATSYQSLSGGRAEPQNREEEQLYGAQKPDRAYSTTLFVGNLAPSVTGERLRSIFSAYGSLHSINFKANKYFAFVTYSNHSDAESAKIAESGRIVDGREMKIGWGKAPGWKSGSVDKNTGEIFQSNFHEGAIPHDHLSSDEDPPRPNSYSVTKRRRFNAASEQSQEGRRQHSANRHEYPRGGGVH